MTEPSENIGRVRWLTFFAAGHAEGGKGGEGGVYPLLPALPPFNRPVRENVRVIRRASDFDYHKLKKKEN
jgi:hypothetical protein